MAPWTDLPLATGEGNSESPYVSDAELFNLHLVPTPPGSPGPFAIHGTPGFSTSGITTTSTGAMRGACVFDGYIWYVNADNIYRHTGFTATLVGALAGVSANCRFADAGTHLVVVDGSQAYTIAKTTHTIAACSRGNFSDVACQDGYTIYTETGSNSWYVSDLDTPGTIGALNFTTADALPGNCVGVESNHREVVVFCEGHTEFYTNVGGSGFPFQRSSPGVVERGCLSADTIAKHKSSTFFVGNDYRAYRLDGYSLTQVSTEWVERLMNEASVTATTFRASVYAYEGRAYYALQTTLTSYNKRPVMDIASGLWHRHEAKTLLDDGFTPWILYGSSYVHDVVNFRPTAASSEVLAFALIPGLVCKLDRDTHTDTGDADPIMRRMVLPPVDSGGVRAFMPEVRLNAERASAASAIELTWMDRMADAAAYTAEGLHQANGQNMFVRWNRLGAFLCRSLRFFWRTNSRVVVSAIHARIEAGAS